MNIFEKINLSNLDRESWIDNNICLLSYGGSRAYDTNNENSDYDYMGFCTMPEPYFKPEKYGYIYGFDELPKFEQLIRTGIPTGDTVSDVTIYGLPYFFKLLSGGNPNVIECLFSEDNKLIYINKIGQKVRENRNLFLANNLINNSLAFATSQLKRINRTPIGKRLELVEDFGYDVKSMAHAMRVLQNCWQVLTTGSMKLNYDANLIKDIRSGKYEYNVMKKATEDFILVIEKIKKTSNLPDRPPVDQVRDLLKECLK